MMRGDATARDIAAYLLDRADQYVTESPCWIALSDAARNIMLGEAASAALHGELDDLYPRVDGYVGRARAVQPRLGVEKPPKHKHTKGKRR